MSNCAVCGKHVKSGVVLHRECFELLHKTQQLDNEPLTREELRKMDGKPVWVEEPGGCRCWALVYLTWRVYGDVRIIYFNGKSDSARILLDDGAKIYRRENAPSWLMENRNEFVPTPMTNADRIRAMSYEELARLLVHTVSDGCPPDMDEQCRKDAEGWDGCDKCWCQWLKRPAEATQ